MIDHYKLSLDKSRKKEAIKQFKYSANDEHKLQWIRLKECEIARDDWSLAFNTGENFYYILSLPKERAGSAFRLIVIFGKMLLRYNTFMEIMFEKSDTLIGSCDKYINYQYKEW